MQNPKACEVVESQQQAGPVFSSSPVVEGVQPEK